MHKSQFHSLKPKDSLFTIMHDKEQQRFLTFKKVEPANVDSLALKK